METEVFQWIFQWILELTDEEATKDEVFVALQNLVVNLLALQTNPADVLALNAMTQEVLDNKDVTMEAERTVVIGLFTRYEYESGWGKGVTESYVTITTTCRFRPSFV